MTDDIIKSGVYVEDVEITPEHIGMELTVVKSSSRYLTEYCSYPIIKVIEGIIKILDDEDDLEDLYHIDMGDINNVRFIFKWAEPIKQPQTTIKSTLTSRKKMAKEIKEVHNNLQLAIANAEQCGMVVVVSSDDVKITYNPPMEEY